MKVNVAAFQTCVDGIGMYSCECGADFDLSTDDLVSCVPKSGRECTADEKTTNCGSNADATCAKVCVTRSPLSPPLSIAV